MSLHDFIFSDNRWCRFFRHICFWLGWFLFSAIGQPSFPIKDTRVPVQIADMFLYQISRSFNRFPGVFLFSYFAAYFLLPLFKKRKFGRFFLFLFMSGLLSYLITLGIFYLLIKKINIQKDPNWSFFQLFYLSFYSNINFTGAVPVCCLMLAIKYYKYWYKKQRLSEQLGRENLQAELQLLKAQIHPHFLFNTLNNIYSFVLTGDPRAAGSVDKLAGMIDYMRAEGENPVVPLEKEISLIKDYTGLEQVRYGGRLDLRMDIQGDYKNKMIAPLLMIPFVENCFKHGASVMRGNQWIHLSINIKDNQLDFHLSNSKPLDHPPQNKQRSIGLVNVQKRLQLLYPGKHSLVISSTDGIYEVHLMLTLQTETIAEKSQEPSKKPAYA